MNYETVCRTAVATPGLLIKLIFEPKGLRVWIGNGAAVLYKTIKLSQTSKVFFKSEVKNP